MNTRTKNTARFVATCALVAACITGVHAADVAQVQVKYDDLNLNSQAGATVLYQRIRGAANEVCGNAGNRELNRTYQAKACVDQAVAHAVAAVNAPSLTGVYEHKTGGVTVERFASN